MKPSTLIGTTCLIATATLMAAPSAPTNAPASPGMITVQEMLVSGPPQLKMHSLAMISQGNVKGSIDESYLPGFKTCSEDISPPIRSMSAKLIGQYFVANKEKPNPEAVALLTQLAKDESSDVRQNAVMYGLCNIENKTEEMLGLLVDFAIHERSNGLKERIGEALDNNRKEVTRILDDKLAEGDNVAVFEVYESLTGKPPEHADKYLDLPSSRPRMFIFGKTGEDAESAQAELEKELQAVGITNPAVQVSGKDDNYVLMIKTYITKEGMAVEKNFSGEGKFKITQQIWLTPEMEMQLEAMQKAQSGK